MGAYVNLMPFRAKLSPNEVQEWVAAHPKWEVVSGTKLARTVTFKDFKSAFAFVAEIARIADEKDHHPDIELGWGRARVSWTTHDSSGITSLDVAMAEATDALIPPPSAV